MNASPGSWLTFDEFLTATYDEPPLLDSERFVSYSLEDLWPTWQVEAHCAGVGHDNFFGNEAEQPTMSIKQVRQASKLCDVCPVYRDCLTWALEQKEEYGVWAGTSGRTRRKIQRMLDAGSTTVEVVVEDFTHGRREQYTEHSGRRGPGSDRRRSSADPSGSSVRAEAVG